MANAGETIESGENRWGPQTGTRRAKIWAFPCSAPAAARKPCFWAAASRTFPWTHYAPFAL